MHEKEQNVITANGNPHLHTNFPFVSVNNMRYRVAGWVLVSAYLPHAYLATLVFVIASVCGFRLSVNLYSSSLLFLSLFSFLLLSSVSISGACISL